MIALLLTLQELLEVPYVTLYVLANTLPVLDVLDLSWCQGWMHRCCAGLSAHICAEISNTSDESEPFLCVYCVLANQAAKIKQLKDSLNSVLSCLPSQNSTAHPPTTNPAANALQPQNNDLSQDISDDDL